VEINPRSGRRSLRKTSGDGGRDVPNSTKVDGDKEPREEQGEQYTVNCWEYFTWNGRYNNLYRIYFKVQFL